MKKIKQEITTYISGVGGAREKVALNNPTYIEPLHPHKFTVHLSAEMLI